MTPLDSGKTDPAEEVRMDWLEQLFGFSPDGGDGTAEILIVLACMIVLAGVIMWRVPALRDRIQRAFARRPIGP
jgi:hypothetical protein